MLNLVKILLPVDFPNTSLGVIHEAATLARHFNSEIAMLHVTTAESHAAGVPERGKNLDGWDMVAEIVKQAERHQDHSLPTELAGLHIQPVLGEGDPFQTIIETAHEQSADLIMMPSHGYTFDHFLLGSLTEEVLSRTECPVWTDAHVEKLPGQKFAIHNVLCAVDFSVRSQNVALWAAQMAAEFGARLTLAHVTYGLETWGPGGNWVNPKLKAELVGDASKHMADLQQQIGTKAEVFIGSGNKAEVLSQAAAETKADLLVNECYPYGVNLRVHGYAIIRAVQIPVVSV